MSDTDAAQAANRVDALDHFYLEAINWCESKAALIDFDAPGDGHRERRIKITVAHRDDLGGDIVKEGTDFLQVVTQARTAYEALDRRQEVAQDRKDLPENIRVGLAFIDCTVCGVSISDDEGRNLEALLYSSLPDLGAVTMLHAFIKAHPAEFHKAPAAS